MSGAVYGGDEVGALVFDIGSHSTRVGFAGEETPKAVFPSYVGTKGDASSDTAMDVDGAERKGSNRVGNTALSTPSDGMALACPIKDGIVVNWDHYDALISHGLESLRVDAQQYPLIFSECAWNSRHARERLTELAFEKYNTPGFFVSKSPVLAAFSTGRYTGIVVDIGATQTSCVPIVDGFVLQKPIVRSHLAGNFIADQARNIVETTHGTHLVPVYEVGGRGAEAHETYRAWRVRALAEDVVAAVATTDLTGHSEQSVSSVAYDFTNGEQREFGAERTRLGEIMFDPVVHASPMSATVLDGDGSSPLAIPQHGLSDMVKMCVDKCDVDVRVSLASSIILAGGGSLIPNLSERLQSDLTSKLSHQMKVKVHTSTMAVERRFASWIGGSILGSLGSFQQLWVSKAEYDEHGKSFVEKKCS